MQPEKAFDINKPGPQMPDPTSRPVISGHDASAIDPMMVAKKAAVQMSASAKTVNPISQDMQPSPAVTSVSNESNTAQISSTQTTLPVAQPSNNTAIEEVVNDARYKELLKTKIYILPTRKDAGHKKFALNVAIGIGIVFLLIVVLLIVADAGIINLPFTLPFDLIQNI